MDRINTQDRSSERNTILVVQHWFLLHFYSVYTQVLHFFSGSLLGVIYLSLQHVLFVIQKKHLKLKLVHF